MLTIFNNHSAKDNDVSEIIKPSSSAILWREAESAGLLPPPAASSGAGSAAAEDFLSSSICPRRSCWIWSICVWCCSVIRRTSACCFSIRSRSWARITCFSASILDCRLSRSTCSRRSRSLSSCGWGDRTVQDATKTGGQADTKSRGKEDRDV